MNTLEASTGRFFNFSAQSQNFTGDLNEPSGFLRSSHLVKNQYEQKELIYTSFER